MPHEIAVQEPMLIIAVLRNAFSIISTESTNELLLFLEENFQHVFRKKSGIMIRYSD
jgi:hypothetical protein